MTREETTAARREAVSGELKVRHCHGLGEFEDCLELQRRVWGGADIELVPLPLFVVAAETGGQVLGAFAGETLLGFTLALAGVRDARPFLHSHMTAVLEDFRDRGVGRQLKLFQRQDALARGIELVEWTFDPLELRNAYFNLVRLGAIVRRFLPNCYGITSSPLHGGLPTDRLMAEWWLRSPRVITALGSGSVRRAGPTVRIRVPAGIDLMRREDPAGLAQVQAEVRQQFERWLGQGYAATGLERAPDGGDYLLEPWRGP